ncbi:transposase, IS605 OrfB family, central region [Shewanella morhuae]|uniref:RNA-guided endonuclease InsQ/TnpB family protein n=1 Tax=Shewanella morhuae TaxID=365591 RepID=UPI000955427C|nr:RNA-guided endonuclease TnpB family protein [Shewanella morhuae]SIR11940.1 transposase, IS605 OrfB family, central region [Shewanella morhuae]
MKTKLHTKTLKIRVRDKHVTTLNAMARSVNFVWNYCNDLSYRSIRERNKWLSGYDLQDYTKGANKELGLNSATVQMIGHEYATRRKQFKKARLNWRKSGGARRSLGWIPVRKDCISFKDGHVYHNRNHFHIWDSYGLSQYTFKSGSFNEDGRGRWYFNVVVEVEAEQSTGTGSVAIDLGCKTAATNSNGDEVTGRHYRKLEVKLGLAQRAKNKHRVKNIHAKIKNRRSDELHKYSRKLVNENAAIFVGNVNSLGLVKTKMAKSVLDAGWGILKTMLEYKCDHAGIVFEEVNESYTTQTCSSCGVIPASSPKGRAGLGIREWSCSHCGTTHDRDINAAKNILAVGHGRLAVGIPHYNQAT